MEEYERIMGRLLLVVIVVWLLWTGLCNGVLYLCQKSVDTINTRCGTHYTAMEYFWVGDNIVIIEKAK